MLVGHQHSVWAIDSFQDLPDSVLTGSADRTVKQWQGDQLLRTFEAHKDVVRSIICLDGGNFITGCNDGKIRCFNREKEKSLNTITTQSEEYIYSMALLDCGFGNDKFLITSMETGVLEMYSVNKKIFTNVKFESALQIPASSAWSVTVLQNNDIAVGGSDGFIYVFSFASDRKALPAVAELFGNRMELFYAERAEIVERMKQGMAQPANSSGYSDPLTGGGRYVPGSSSSNFMPISSLSLDRKRPRGLLAPLSTMITFGDLPPAHIALDKLVTCNAAQENATKLSDEQVCLYF